MLKEHSLRPHAGSTGKPAITDAAQAMRMVRGERAGRAQDDWL